MQFTHADLLIAASDVPEGVDLRNLHGPGRILHFDRQFRLKRVLPTGTDGLVIAVGVDPLQGDLYAADARARSIVRFNVNGRPIALAHPLPALKFGSLRFAKSGICYLGVHNSLGENKPPAESLARWDPHSGELTLWPAAVDGGKLGFHCVSHISLDPSQRMLRYVSENGRRVMQFDVVAGRQLDDFLVLDEDDERGTFGLDHLADGRLLMATGNGVSLFSGAGRELHRYDVTDRRGWSRVTVSRDQGSFFLNNFLDGTIEQRNVADGIVLRSHNIGKKNALCGIDQYPRITAHQA